MNPHSGYHWRGSSGRFFEGWYFRLTLPDPGQTFAFMYSIDDPAGNTPAGKTNQSGGAVQILGPDEAYYCRTFPNVQQFWAWPHRLGLGHWRAGMGAAKYLAPEQFEREVKEGYQVCDRPGRPVGSHLHQGKLLTPVGATKPQSKAPIKAQWHYQVTPIESWGTPTPRATAGWLSYFPIFEPGWQVLMAHGLATGWIDWWADELNPNSEPVRYSFENVPAYAEKNWGGAFPAKWFWLQCNAFADEPTLSVTAAGGVREVLILTENVGLIGIHYKGQFYEFLSTQTAFDWQVEPWGYWHLTAQSHRYRVVLTGRAHDEGTWVRVPTREGLQFLCRDTTHGELRLQLWECAGSASAGTDRLIVETTSQLAGLEVGGGPWRDRWSNR
ncbi:MAG: tocopherol cyclase [Phormidesmis priestleyi Ana]|uniref:Tocopherol cyclase n=1 Tax=Phormidesmis priestleyi Ana TaxID=1666911 RepID=A0A0P7YTP5_9CYAN|nr:MAG: tocopherol cyclase [Phormidesmis priestleyi Ana]